MHLAVADYEQQETSSFPDEIKTKLMKMNEEHFLQFKNYNAPFGFRKTAQKKINSIKSEAKKYEK